MAPETTRPAGSSSWTTSWMRCPVPGRFQREEVGAASGGAAACPRLGGALAGAVLAAEQATVAPSWPRWLSVELPCPGAVPRTRAHEELVTLKDATTEREWSGWQIGLAHDHAVVATCAGHHAKPSEPPGAREARMVPTAPTAGLEPAPLSQLKRRSVH